MIIVVFQAHQGTPPAYVLEGDRVPAAGLVIKRGVEEGEEPSYSVVHLWDSVEASKDMKGVNVPVKGDIHIPTETSDVTTTAPS